MEDDRTFIASGPARVNRLLGRPPSVPARDPSFWKVKKKLSILEFAQERYGAVAHGHRTARAPPDADAPSVVEGRASLSVLDVDLRAALGEEADQRIREADGKVHRRLAGIGGGVHIDAPLDQQAPRLEHVVVGADVFLKRPDAAAEA